MNNAMETLTMIQRSSEKHQFKEDSGPLPDGFTCRNADDEEKEWRKGAINRCSSLEFRGVDILTQADEIGVNGVRYSEDTSIAWVILSGQAGWEPDVVYQIDLLAIDEAAD